MESQLQFNRLRMKEQTNYKENKPSLFLETTHIHNINIDLWCAGKVYKKQHIFIFT